ncbi:ABC transporter permease subunit [Pontibacillus yanchengensis]|uniref:ABC transporter permease subunit n=2 Tax=Pontibacillus yanchengensis TaxID=462910 RepID=A0ACC7VDV9_9BACI|nr:proline/glycine betaine ABC transporter permease [Pontibacillus yanchengensis]MYL32510.1 ABC transporter permease subunit [Pontibacillus yanchengensis]MYL53091.1 ABC transporter permease subunit [Pontibacillus yanchengensis]
MNEHFPDIQLSLGDYVESFIMWINDVFAPLFDFIFFIASRTMLGIEQGLLFLPWWLFIILVFLLGWRFKSLGAGVLYGFFIFLVGTFGLWEVLMTTISIVVTSVFISLLFGIPLGVWMAFSRGFSFVMRPILDAMQTMPSFVYLIPAIFFFGLGNVAAVFATLIYAIPPVIRLTELAIRNVNAEVIESAESFGSSRWQMLKKVQLPQALPTIMAGVNQTTMMALAMVVIASMVGAKGLGEQVLISINRIDLSLGFEAGISIVFLAILIDRITGGVADRFQKHRGAN